MGRDCKYCGAYISDIVDVCPACGKKIKPEKPSAVESYDSASRSASYAKAASQAERNERFKNGGATGSAAPAVKENYNTSESEYGTEEKRTNNYQYRYNDSSQAERENYGGAGSDRGQNFEETVLGGDDDLKKNRAICYLCYFGLLFLVPYLTRKDSPFVKYHSNQGLLLLIADVAVSICGSIPFIGWLISLIGGIFILVSFITGLSNVGKGVMKPLPVIGDIVILK